MSVINTLYILHKHNILCILVSIKLTKNKSYSPWHCAVLYLIASQLDVRPFVSFYSNVINLHMYTQQSTKTVIAISHINRAAADVTNGEDSIKRGVQKIGGWQLISGLRSTSLSQLNDSTGYKRVLYTQLLGLRCVLCTFRDNQMSSIQWA